MRCNEDYCASFLLLIFLFSYVSPLEFHNSLNNVSNRDQICQRPQYELKYGMSRQILPRPKESFKLMGKQKTKLKSFTISVVSPRQQCDAMEIKWRLLFKFPVSLCFLLGKRHQ